MRIGVFTATVSSTCQHSLATTHIWSPLVTHGHDRSQPYMYCLTGVRVWVLSARTAMGTVNLVTSSISKRRAREDLSQLALAKQIGISSGQLAALESGRDVPSLFTLKRLAKFFAWEAEEIGKYVLASNPAPTGPKRLRTHS